MSGTRATITMTQSELDGAFVGAAGSDGYGNEGPTDDKLVSHCTALECGQDG